MVPVLALLLLLLIAFWLWREFASARRRRNLLATRDARGRPMPPPHQRVDDATLNERVRVLRAAVDRGDVPLEEAAGSLIRLAGGAMTPERARSLLSKR